jgi:hypothetical protein
VTYELWLPDDPDDQPPHTINQPTVDEYAGPPVAVTYAPQYIESLNGGVRDNHPMTGHGVEIVNPQNDVQHIGPDTESRNPFTFELQLSPLPDPRDTLVKVDFLCKVRVTPANSTLDDPSSDKDNVPGGVAAQKGGPYKDSVTITLDCVAIAAASASPTPGGGSTTSAPPSHGGAPGTVSPNLFQLYFKSSKQDRDGVVEVTAVATIKRNLGFSSYDYTAKTTLLARAFFPRPRVSFTSKQGSDYVPIDDRGIIPVATIDDDGSIIAHSIEHEIYLEYRTDDPDPNNPTATVNALAYGGSLMQPVTLTKVDATPERALFRSKPMVCYLERPECCGLTTFQQLSSRTTGIEYLHVR